MSRLVRLPLLSIHYKDLSHLSFEIMLLLDELYTLKSLKDGFQQPEAGCRWSTTGYRVIPNDKRKLNKSCLP